MITIRFATELLIAGTPVKIAGDPLISESIDSFGTIIEFDLLDRPDPLPAEGVEVEVRRVNLDVATYVPLFSGYLTGRVTESEPHALALRAVDELSKFAALRTTNDLNLTGMTDGEAWQVIAGVCDVDFDPLDIVDTGYVLGEQAPVYWKVDTSGASIIDELDRVLSCKTMTVLNNRVCRIFYDRVAHSADIQVSYTKGESESFFRNRKEAGDSSQVQSLWTVQGVTTPCGDCSCLVWAKSVGTTPKRGKKISRIPTSTFQSDLIQDEVLAQAVSRRLMRWYNRVPVVVNAEVVTDPNLHPGSVIGLVDPTYGIGDTSTKPYFVTAVDRRGSEMTVTAIGGTGGSTGTTTSGVEQRCNDTSLNLDWGGDWDFDTISFPPIGADIGWTGGFDFDFDVHGDDDEGGGVSGNWVANGGSPEVGTDFVHGDDAPSVVAVSGAAYFDGEYGDGTYLRLTGVVTLPVPMIGGSCGGSITMRINDDYYHVGMSVSSDDGLGSTPPGALFYYWSASSPTDSYIDSNAGFDGTIPFEVVWSGSTMSVSLDGGAVTASLGYAGGEPDDLNVDVSSSSAGGVDFDSLVVETSP